MKIKHNKKRNTAFVFESLLREATVAIIKGDTDKQHKVVQIIKKHFTADSELKKHLECYRSLYENQSLNAQISEKILTEAKMASRLIDPHGLFKSQTELINDINTTLSPSVFNNFVPNYKTLATIDQIFCDKLPPKTRVMLESTIVENMTKSVPENVVNEEIDNTTVSCFVGKFNDKYSETLSEEQKQLLSHYITSFTDNAVSLKMFLNEEIVRLKKVITESSTDEMFTEDAEMKQKASQIIEKLEGFKKAQINDDILLTVLKTQELVKEMSNGSNN
ncbi:MAG: hypothetical protein VW683_17285 [Betaproteobacteria bacterium]